MAARNIRGIIRLDNKDELGIGDDEPLTRNRRGKFKIKANFLVHHPQLVFKVMAQMVIWRAEYLGMEGVVQYHAESELFDEVDVGDKPPVYSIGIEGGRINVEKAG